MRLKALFLFVSVWLLLSVGWARALTPGPTIYRECPHCKKQIRQFTIGTGNTIGARWWTDGFMRAPMLPAMPWLVKCPHCQGLLWMNDAKELGRGGDLSFLEFKQARESLRAFEPSNAKEPLDALEADYLAAAAVRGLARERELHARLQAWWLANDPAREPGKPATVWTQSRTNNLNRLFTLLDERNDCERIRKAEIARELGRFADCLKLLAQPVSKDCADTARQIGQLAKQKKTRVGEILPKD
jgi:hypothetical protein